MPRLFIFLFDKINVVNVVPVVVEKRIKEDKKCSERLCAVAPNVMRVLFFLYASIHKNIPSRHPFLRSGTIAFAEKSSFVAEKGLCEAEKEGPRIIP